MSRKAHTDIIRASTLDIPRIQHVAAETWPATFREILSPGQIAYMMDLMYATESLCRYGFTTVSQEDIPIGNGYTMNDLIMEYSFGQPS